MHNDISISSNLSYTSALPCGKSNSEGESIKLNFESHLLSLLLPHLCWLNHEWQFVNAGKDQRITTYLAFYVKNNRNSNFEKDLLSLLFVGEALRWL